MYFNREDYGSRIRSLRKNRGLTQEQLAEKMNVSTPYCWRREIATIFCREYLTNFCRR